MGGHDARILAIAGLSGPIVNMPGSWALVPLIVLLMLVAVYLAIYERQDQ